MSGNTNEQLARFLKLIHTLVKCDVPETHWDLFLELMFPDTSANPCRYEIKYFCRRVKLQMEGKSSSLEMDWESFWKCANLKPDKAE